MIVKPEEMDFSDKNIIMIISGLPGVGKTTLALSAPDVVLIDADEGNARVNVAHRKDSSIVKSYEELLADVKSFKGKYKTAVVDTGGALIELMKDWAMRTDSKASRSNGGFSLQGYGIIKVEFARLFAELRRDFNVIMLFHAAADKRGEDTFFDIVCEGAAKNIVWQPADLGAYLHIVNGERWLGFTPTANYNAKAAYGIKGLMKIPELKDGEANNFLSKLFEHVKKNIKAESNSLGNKTETYEKTMETGKAIIAKIECAENVISSRDAIKALKHALTSKDELGGLLKGKLEELKITFNRETKTYEQKK